MRRQVAALLGVLALLVGCQSTAPQESETASMPTATSRFELEYIPDGYRQPAENPGTLEQLTYSTYESFGFEQRTQELTKRAWTYLPPGYSAEQDYNVFYLSHGGWSNETTWLGTAEAPSDSKHILDHAIADGKIEPLIVVAPTYNNTSPEDSGDYQLALQLTENFHRELLQSLLPAVEAKYSTYATGTSPDELIASRDHRGFGGFSMGSVNTWQTFRHGLDYFRYFAPSIGALTSDGEALAQVVRDSRYSPDDFFIVAASGTDDFAYAAFKSQIDAMAATDVFVLADDEASGNLVYREREGYRHDTLAAQEYVYNALRMFWVP